MKRTMLICTTAFVVLAGAAQAQEANVLHYWTSGSEAGALQKIADAFEAKGGKWVDEAVAGFDAERTIALTRFAAGDPPDAMLTELGQETRNLAEAGLLRDLSPLYTENGWTEVLAPSVIAALSVDEKIFAVPVDIGGRNWMYSNNEVMAAAGVEVPKTWDEFFVAADKIKAAGYIPLALGGQSWQEDNLFTSVLGGVGGAEFFRKIYEEGDAEAARSATMVEVFAAYRKLGDYVDAGSPGRAWNDTTNLVITGKAAMIVMGDWAKGEFVAAGQTAGKEFTCSLAPAKDPIYDAIVDAFVFPSVDAGAQAGQDLLIQTMMDPAVQVAFNSVKGSLPPRSDAKVSDLDICAELGAETLASPDTYVPAIINRPTNDVSGQLEDIVSQFWNSPNMSPEEAAEAYASVLDFVK